MQGKLPPLWWNCRRHFVTEPQYQSRILQALETTWPAAGQHSLGPWTLRDGQGGGKRVSAASLRGADATAKDIAEAETAMTALGQDPLFMIRPQDQALDVALEARGYRVIDPVIAYLGPISTLAASLPSGLTAYPLWPPLAVAREIWEDAGIGPARLAVMARANEAKTALLLRRGDHPAGLCFVAMAGDIAMLHALEVVQDQRRHGVGRALVQGAATWAQAHGAQDLALVVTAANVPARALYAGLGMTQQGRYHYRQRP